MSGPGIPRGMPGAFGRANLCQAQGDDQRDRQRLGMPYLICAPLRPRPDAPERLGWIPQHAHPIEDSWTLEHFHTLLSVQGGMAYDLTAQLGDRVDDLRGSVMRIEYPDAEPYFEMVWVSDTEPDPDAE